MCIDFFLNSYIFCCQGETGVGVPGARGERGDPGPRVRHSGCVTDLLTSLLKYMKLRIVYFCSSCVCRVLGRGGSSWIGRGERIICKYPVFPLFRSKRSLSTKDLNFLFKPKDDLFWAVKQRTQAKSYCYYRKAALHKVTVHFLHCKLFSQSVFGFSVHCS